MRPINARNVAAYHGYEFVQFSPGLCRSGGGHNQKSLCHDRTFGIDYLNAAWPLHQTDALHRHLVGGAELGGKRDDQNLVRFFGQFIIGIGKGYRRRH
jgi:hypothetical protein